MTWRLRFCRILLKAEECLFNIDRSLVEIIKFNIFLISYLIENDDSDGLNVFRFLYFLLIVTFAPILPSPINYIFTITLSFNPILTLAAYAFERYFKKIHTNPPVERYSGKKLELITVVGSRLHFYPVQILDFDKFDDAFSPDHSSIIYCVEIRESLILRSRSLIVWRVSMLNGERTEVHKFRLPCLCYAIFLGVECFESAGVIFVKISTNAFRHRKLLYGYDTRYRRSAKYILPDEVNFSTLSSCMDRLWNENGFVEGWKIRFVETQHSRIGEQNFSWNTRILIKNFGLRETFFAIDREEIDMGNFSGHHPFVREVRNSSGLLIVFASNYRNYDDETIDVLRSNLSIDIESNRSILRKRARFPHYFSSIFSSDTEEIVFDTIDKGIYRIGFGPATLKYLAARAVFRLKPNFRHRLAIADRFYENWERILGKKSS